MIYCACGCGIKIKNVDGRNRPKRFVHSHNLKFVAGNKNAKSINVNTMYTRSKLIKKERFCEISHIGFCMGTIDVCHIDQDFTNNNLKNLISLCRSHHRLLDNGKINLKNPVMPAFYEDKSGKRRYL